MVDNFKPYCFPGKDYYNPGIAEFANVSDFMTDLISRDNYPRMPWHDVHMVCDGAAAQDIAKNFIQRWNHHVVDLNCPYPLITPLCQFLPPKGTLSVQVLRSISGWSVGVSKDEQSIYNAYLKEIEAAQHMIYIENQFFISSTAGSAVLNTIAKIILIKILSAAEERRVSHTWFNLYYFMNYCGSSNSRRFV
jgi:phospholipase D1/2